MYITCTTYYMSCSSHILYVPHILYLPYTLYILDVLYVLKTILYYIPISTIYHMSYTRENTQGRYI